MTGMVVAGTALLCWAPAASAQVETSPFPDYRAPATAQYATPSATAASADDAAGAESTTGIDTATGPRARRECPPAARARASQNSDCPTGRDRSRVVRRDPGGRGPGANGRRGVPDAPVVVRTPSQPAPRERGELPFTGSEPWVLALLGLALLAAGLLLAAAARTTRRLRRPA